MIRLVATHPTIGWSAVALKYYDEDDVSNTLLLRKKWSELLARYSERLVTHAKATQVFMRIMRFMRLFMRIICVNLP